MKKFTPKRRVMAALLGGPVDRIPATSVAGCGGTVNLDMQKATGIMWPDAHKDPQKMAKLAIASYELAGVECIRVPFDFVVEAEVLGCEIKWFDSPEHLPAVKTHPFAKVEDLKMPDNVLEKGRIPVVLEAIRQARKQVGDYLPIAGHVVGPFTIAGELPGIENFLKWIVKNPDNIVAYTKFAYDFVLQYAKAQFQAGADIVCIAEPMASLEMISVDWYRKFVKPVLIELTNNLGGIRVLHICGRTEKLVPDMCESGFDGISIEEAVNIANIKNLVGDVKILGNVSSKKTLVFGTPEEVKAEAINAIQAGADLLEPGCGISSVVPLANVKAFVDAAKEYVPKK